MSRQQGAQAVRPAFLADFLAREGDGLVAVRRHLHAHPELGRAEVETTGLVSRRLEAAGLAPRTLPGGSGLVCDIGRPDAPALAIRADIDALPLADEKDVPYRSTVEGVCHACGHDVHTTMVLGAGLALGELVATGELPGRVRLLFQPAEELTPGGALDVIAAGGLDDVDRVVALHCDPKLEVGKVGVRVGPITGAADMVEVRLRGPGGHTARPHLTADVVYVLARVVADLPGGLSRLADPRAGLSIVWGSVQAGMAANAIPQAGVARGTVRVLDHATWELAPQLVRGLVEATVAPFGAEATLDYRRGVPPVVNDAGCTALLARAATEALGAGAAVPTEQSLGGEDFSWYLEKVPGALARLGVQLPGTDLDLHQGTFDIDERAIGVGVRLLVQTALHAVAG